jgi:hypothetical protein
METNETTPTDSRMLPEPSFSLTPGQVIGDRYRIEEPLGSGGMGVVCRATHLGLETPVAIKLIRPDFNADAEFVRRFLNEARRAAVLHSDRVARVHDVGQLDSGEPFLVMELLEGLELSQYMKQNGPLTPSDALNIALQICEGLAEAHANGIVHRDIKPGNTFLVRRADGRFGVKILDFGISKQLGDGAATLNTNSGQSLGSPWYMSPEQMLDASRVDHRSDIWSLGVLLFEMLTDHRPFDGATVPEVCAKVLTAPAPSIRYWRPELDPELEAIVAHCLEKHPDERYPDVSALGAELHEYVARGPRADARIEPTSFFQPIDPNEGSIAPIAATRMSTRRRMRFAHALGIVGLFITVAVAGLAFGQRTLLSARRGAERVRADIAAARAPNPAPTVTTAPTVAPEPAPVVTPVPPVTSTPVAPVDTAPASPAPPATNVSAAPVSAPSPAPVAATPAPSPLRAATKATAAAEPADETGADLPEPAARHRPADPDLSASEIDARKERYVRWLAEEGLKRIDSVDQVDDNPFK